MTEKNELDEILDMDTGAAENTPESKTEESHSEADGEKADGVEAVAEKPEVKASEEPDPVESESDDKPEKSGVVPHQALHESRQREKAASDRAEALERSLLQMQGQLEAVQRQVAGQQPQSNEKAEPPDFWEDPNGFVAAQLSPIEKRMRQQAEQMSQRFAIQEYGREQVEKAYVEFGKALQTDPTLSAQYERIKASDHPYGDIVKWYKQQQTIQRVGEDPEKWLEAEMEKRLSDPAKQAEILKRIQSTAVANSQDSPVTNLPRSLSNLPGGANSAVSGDVDDEALFKHAMG